MTTDVWGLYGQLAGQEASTLTPAQRALVSVCDLRQEVNAGGFENYFRAWGGNSAEDALAALPTLLGPDWANLLADAMRLLGMPYPRDPDERGRMIDRGDLESRLHELDDRFYDLEGSIDADARLGTFYTSNLL